MNAARRTREAVKASAAITWWVGTSREIEARANAGRRHVVASRAHAEEGSRAKAQAHLRLAEDLFLEIRGAARERRGEEEPVSTPDARAFDEHLFWDMIESAWRRTPDGQAQRRELAAGESQDPDAALAPFLTELDRVLGHLTADGLRTFGRELERALFALDCEELARRIGLGDDGFGDARATIVLLGERHYRAVLADAARAYRGPRRRARVVRLLASVGEALRRERAELRYAHEHGQQPGRLGAGSRAASAGGPRRGRGGAPRARASPRHGRAATRARRIPARHRPEPRAGRARDRARAPGRPRAGEGVTMATEGTCPVCERVDPRARRQDGASRLRATRPRPHRRRLLRRRLCALRGVERRNARLPRPRGRRAPRAAESFLARLESGAIEELHYEAVVPVPTTSSSQGAATTTTQAGRIALVSVRRDETSSHRQYVWKGVYGARLAEARTEVTALQRGFARCERLLRDWKPGALREVPDVPRGPRAAGGAGSGCRGSLSPGGAGHPRHPDGRALPARIVALRTVRCPRS